MSDEEKKAIDVIKSLGISIYDEKSQIIHADTTKEISTAIYTTINLIEKQSKEIEELKENNKLLQDNYSSAHEDINWFCENYISKEESGQRERKAYIKGTNDAHELCNKMCKDKIKAILNLDEECDSEEKVLVLLETIWDEFNRLNDIEDRKVQVEYQKVFNKGVKSVEDKIKALIEERKEKIKKLHPASDCVIIDELETEINVLEELLEKE